MEVFVAGAPGPIGMWLVPQLLDAGHEVIGTTRLPEKTQTLRALGVHVIVADALDEERVVRVVPEARPKVIVHQLTALTNFRSIKHFDDEFTLTNRLRTEGQDYLLEADRVSGTRQVNGQRFTGWPSNRQNGPIKTAKDLPDTQRVSVDCDDTGSR